MMETVKKAKTSKKAVVLSAECVACGSCTKACPFGALSIPNGTVAIVDHTKCIGCGKCVKACPASIIQIESVHLTGSAQPAGSGQPAGGVRSAESGQPAEGVRSAGSDQPAEGFIACRTIGADGNGHNTADTSKKAIPTPVKHRKRWYDYLWIASSLYLILGFFNILFAWLGLLCFMIPLMISIIKGSKSYCHKYCGRGQLFQLIGGKLGISAGRSVPKWLRSKWFRYGFLTFFMTMFVLMLFNTYMVFSGAQSLKETVTLLWTFHLPWNWVNTSMVSPWAAQFAFGFYSLMLTSTILGLVTMLLFKPRSWCVYCPMGTMTQGICHLKS